LLSWYTFAGVFFPVVSFFDFRRAFLPASCSAKKLLFFRPQAPLKSPRPPRSRVRGFSSGAPPCDRLSSSKLGPDASRNDIPYSLDGVPHFAFRWTFFRSTSYPPCALFSTRDLPHFCLKKLMKEAFKSTTSPIFR